MDNDGEWTRSENFLTDMLRLFEEGMYYDCTFQLVSKETGVSKVVKCHKAVLCASSCVFAKMLFGHFREAHQSADDPIPLPGVTLEVFQFIMRELYGQAEKKFDNVEFAMDVYKFAHEMQMPSVMHAVNLYLKTISSSEALSVLDLCIQLDNKEGLQKCKEVLQRIDFKEVVNYAVWLELTERVLQEVLQLQQLNLSELEVACAVLMWGRAQVKADGHDPTDINKLRQKIDSSLKFIRWPQFTSKQFSELCQGDLGLVLSAEEKSKIQECICLGIWKMIAAHLLGPASLTPRSRGTFSVGLCFQKNIKNPLQGLPMSNSSSFDFVVDKCCYFMGLKFTPLPNCSATARAEMHPSSIIVSEFEYPRNCTRYNCKRDALECAFMLTSGNEFMLDAGIKYTVRFMFPRQYPADHNYQVFNIGGHDERKKMVKQKNSLLTVLVQTPMIGVQISEMIFKMRETANLK